MLSETALRRTEIAVEELTGTKLNRGSLDWVELIADALEAGVEAKHKLGIVEGFVKAIKEMAQILRG